MSIARQIVKAPEPKVIATIPAMRTKTFKEAEGAGIITKVGRPPSGKVVTTLRLDPRIIERLKAEGDGWQARANDILLRALNL